MPNLRNRGGIFRNIPNIFDILGDGVDRLLRQLAETPPLTQVLLHLAGTLVIAVILATPSSLIGVGRTEVPVSFFSWFPAL